MEHPLIKQLVGYLDVTKECPRCRGTEFRVLLENSENVVDLKTGSVRETHPSLEIMEVACNQCEMLLKE